MMGGNTQEQKTIQPTHIDHDSHFSWTHAYMFPVYGMVLVGLIAGAVKIYIARSKK